MPKKRLEAPIIVLKLTVKRIDRQLGIESKNPFQKALIQGKKEYEKAIKILEEADDQG